MSSDRFPAFHVADKNVATLNYVAGQSQSRSLQLQHRYQYITGVLTLSLTGGGAAPVSAAQEGALAIIERLYVTVNGNQAGKYETSGKQLYIRSFQDSRKQPMGFEALTNATKTYKVYFQWRYAPSQIRQTDIFALDLLKESGNSSLMSNAEVNVNWGTANSLWHNAGGMTVADAKLELWGSETMLPAGRVYNRANEMIVRNITKTFNAGDSSVEVEIPRLNGGYLVDIAVAQYARKAANDFTNENGILRLKNDDYEWKGPPIGVHRSRQNVILDDTPDNMLFLSLVENNDINTALPDAAFTDNLDLSIPVNDGASTDAMTVDVFATFVKRAQVN